MTEPNLLPTFAGWLVALGEDVLSLANLLESSEARPRWRRVSAEALESLLRASELIPEGLESLGYLEQAFVFRLLARRSLDGDGADESYVAELGSDPADVPLEVGDASEALDALEALDASEASFGGFRSGPAPEESFDGPVPEAEEAREESFGGPAAEAAEGPPAGAEEHRTQTVLDEPAAETSAARDDDVPARLARLAADAPLVEELVGADLPALQEMAFVAVRRGRRAQELLVDTALRAEVLREARAWVERYHAPELADAPEELVKLRSFFHTRLLRAS